MASDGGLDDETVAAVLRRILPGAARRLLGLDPAPDDPQISDWDVGPNELYGVPDDEQLDYDEPWEPDSDATPDDGTAPVVDVDPANPGPVVFLGSDD